MPQVLSEPRTEPLEEDTKAELELSADTVPAALTQHEEITPSEEVEVGEADAEIHSPPSEYMVF